MLTQEQLKHLNDEVMGLKPISPMPEFKTDEADSYAFTPEATKPAEPLPQEYQSAQVGGGFADLTFPSLTEENNTPEDFQQAFKEKLPGVSSFVGEAADRVETSLATGAVEQLQEETGMKTLDAWKTYTNARPEVLREVRNISIETGIPEKVILYSPDSLNKARNLYNYRRKQMALAMPGGKNDPGLNEVTMDQLMEAYPGLDKIIKGDSVTEAAIALENLENVRQMKGILDAGVIGYKRGLKQREMQKVGMAAFEAGRDVTEEELKRYRELEDEYKNMLEAPDFFDSPMVSLAGKTAEQMPQQAWGLLKGTLYGGVLAGTAAGATAAISPLTGGASLAAAPAAAKWGFGVGMRVGYAEDMWTHSAAQRYLEYSQYKDENGKKLLTNAEAQAYAAVAAAVETGIEFANAETIVRVLKGNKTVAAEQIRNIVSGAKDQASFIAGMKQVLSGMKEIAFSETLEEGAQEISDRLLSNAAHAVWGGNIPTYTPGEVAVGGLEAMAEAFLPSLGFAAMAGGSGSFKAVRRAAALSELNTAEFGGWWKNINGIGMLNRMMEDKGILQYFKSDPEVAKKTLQGTVEGTAYENVNIDTEYARKKENGEEALREVAKAAGISDDAVQAAIDTNATLSVPTAVYLQTKVNTENFALDNDVLTFSDEAPCLAKEKDYYEAQKARLETLMASADIRQMEQQQAAVDKIVENTFTDKADREAATEVILLNPTDPSKGLRELRSNYQTQADELLAPIMETVRRMAPKKVTDANIRKTAMSILAGTYEGDIPAYLNTPEVQEFLGANAIQLKSLQDAMNRLDAIKEKIASIDTDELQTMEGMSNDAYEVYKELSNQIIATAPNKAVKRSAKAGAALLARRADIYAQAKREAGEKDYTARDYYNELFGISLGGEYEGGVNKSFLQSYSADFARQKDVVRKQYEGTDGWMMAPNGQPTNLTEEQWLTVRTKNFRRWFGNWNYDGNKQVPVIDLDQYQFLDKDGNEILPKTAKELNEWFASIYEDKFPVEIKDDGSIVVATKKHFDDSLKRFRRGDQAKVYKALWDVIENSAYYDSERNDGQEKHKNLEGQDVYYSAVKIGGQKFIVRLKLDAFHNAEDNIRNVYKDHKIIKKIDVLAYPDIADETSGPLALATPILNEILPNIADTVNTQSAEGQEQETVRLADLVDNKAPEASAILDENGEPLVVYHGSDADFDTFDRTKGRANMDIQGSFFSPWKEDAGGYGENVRAFFLNIRNPANEGQGYKALNKYKGQNGAGIKAREDLTAQGFDGVNNENEEYIAFEPNQIKSIDNNGNFSSLRDNVYLQETKNASGTTGNKDVRGATEFMSDGKRILKVFGTGNESTIAHELGHIFLDDIRALAEMENAPEQIVKDWETVKEWLGWKPDQTTLSREQHEKFAKGFEAYLMSGEAPARGLKKVFRQFKAWLKRIYKDFLALGGKPSDDIQKVMGRMIASADEVETAFQLRGSEYFEQAGATQQLDASSLAMYQRWKNEATQYAEEQVLAIAMQDLTEKRKQELESTRQKLTEDIQAKLKEEPVYKADALLEANPAMKDNFPAEQLGITYEEYQEQIKERGSIEDETNRLVDAAMQEVEDKMPMAEIKEAAERAVTSSNYRSLYVAFERSFMMEKQQRTERLAEDIDKTLDAIEAGIAAEEIDTALLKDQLDELRSQTRWTVKEMNLINSMTMAAEQAQQKEELKEAIRKTVGEFRQLLNETREHVHVYRDTAYTSRKVIRQYAEEKMAAMSIPDATNVAKWVHSERLTGHQSATALRRALNASLRNSGTEKAQERISKLWQEANDLKTQQLVYAEMAVIAQRNADVVRKKNARLKTRMKSIRKNNSVPVQERYMYHHGLFVLGLEKQDAPVPQNKPDILSMFQYYADDMSAYFLDENGNVWMPDYLIAAMAGNEIYKETGYKSLTMEQYGEFTDALDTIYRVGMDANKIKTVKDPNGQEVKADVIIDTIVAETNSRVYEIDNPDVTNAGSPTFGQRVWNKAREGKVKLVKIESVLEAMGPAAERYIYEPVNRARSKEMVMLEEIAKKTAALWSKYTMSEMSEMRSKKQFKFGTSVLTREEMMCVALNWGTEKNRQRVMDGFRVTEDTVMGLLANLTEKDWQVVEGMWELTNSFWDETVATEERVAGIAPKKEEAVAFTVMGNDGKIHDLKGGYYHIKYDPSKSLRVANREQDDIARQNMRNKSAMNRNLGFTKQRSSGPVEHPLLLSFDVFTKNLYDVVHNICFREALRDVRRIVTNDKIVDVITTHYGQYQAEQVQQWVLDCWAREKTGLGFGDQLMRFFRHKQTQAALGHNITTALLNVLNIFPMTHYLGEVRTRQAITDFYENRAANWQFCLDKSPFLRERAETMDRDAGEVLRDEFHGGHGAVIDAIEMGGKMVSKSAFKVMAMTDLMLANPLWLAEYQRVYQEMMPSTGQVTDEQLQRIEAEAISAGDKAVRKVFGSGDIKDLAPIQKGSELDKLLTMYYSYFNVVFNALYSGYAKGRRLSKQNNSAYHIPDILPFIGGADVKIEIRPVVDAILYWTVLTGVSEGILRKGKEVLTGNDDGEDGWLMAAFKGWRDNLFGTIPYIRDAFVSAMDIVMGERYYGARPLPAYQVVDNFQKLWNAIIKDKKTKIDVFREGSRLANQFSGVSNTVTDAFATTAYWVDSDFDTPFYQYLAAVLLDRRIDRKKKK